MSVTIGPYLIEAHEAEHHKDKWVCVVFHDYHAETWSAVVVHRGRTRYDSPQAAIAEGRQVVEHWREDAS